MGKRYQEKNSVVNESEKGKMKKYRRQKVNGSKIRRYVRKYNKSETERERIREKE